MLYHDFSGLGFAYFGHNWAFHGLYIFGLSLMFFAGVLLVIALWPWDTNTIFSQTRPMRVPNPE